VVRRAVLLIGRGLDLLERGVERSTEALLQVARRGSPRNGDRRLIGRRIARRAHRRVADLAPPGGRGLRDLVDGREQFGLVLGEEAGALDRAGELGHRLAIEHGVALDMDEQEATHGMGLVEMRGCRLVERDRKRIRPLIGAKSVLRVDVEDKEDRAREHADRQHRDEAEDELAQQGEIGEPHLCVECPRGGPPG